MLLYQELKKMGGEKFHSEGEKLVFSADKINITSTAGQSVDGSFVISGPSGESVNGFVSASMPSMKILNTEFSGARDEISYHFDTSAYAGGEKAEGFFRIISNHGEYRLPFTVEIAERYPDSSIGPVKNLLTFTNLAKTNWKEAVSVFRHPDFKAVFSENEHQEYAYYRGLSARDNEQNVEEFLISIGKKEPCSFIPDSNEIKVDAPTPENKLIVRRLMIRSNGWGYINLRVETNGEFLCVQQPVLTAVDFRTGTCELAVGIDPSCLHNGRNFGKIVLSTPFESIDIAVTVSYCADTALKTMHRREQRDIVLKMMRNYESFRSRRKASRDFYPEMEALIRRLYEIDRTDPLIVLYRIHYLITVKKFNDARWELKALSKRLSGIDEGLPDFSTAHFDLEDDIVYAYRMYLTELCAQHTAEDQADVLDITSSAIHGIESMHNGNPDNWWITWLLMYAGDEYERRPSRAWMLLQDQFMRGCRSPILYIEAYQMIAMNPAILHGLGEFELQVLLYAARHSLLNAAVLTQVNYLAVRAKTFSDKLFRVLCAGYSIEGLSLRKRETLESICTILIRGNETDSRYFEWYERGVENQLTITRLFEFYMLSLPADFRGEIPRMVIMYFAYQSTLPYERNAYLYRYLLEHEKEYAEILEQYKAQIDSFTIDSLMQHRISEDLAYLYERYLTSGRVLAPEAAAAAVPCIFTCIFRTKRSDIHRVVLVYDRTYAEQYFPIEQGRALFPVYGKDCHLFLEDDLGNRFAKSVKYDCVHMLGYEKLAVDLGVYEINNAGYDLFMEGLPEDEFRLNEANEERYARLAQMDSVFLKYRQEIIYRLIKYYSQNDLVRQEDQYLLSVDSAELTKEQQKELINLMALRGINEKALSWIARMGTADIDGKTLLSVCTGFVDDENCCDDPVFTGIAYDTFCRGYYNEKLLLYLENYFDGLTDELELVRKAVADFRIDDYMILKKILVQVLYTGRKIDNRNELVDRFIRSGADNDLLAGILAQSSHCYFVENAQMDDAQFDLIADFGRGGVPLLDICRIAWLYKRAGASGEAFFSDGEVTALFLADLMNEGIIFPFFRQFIGILPALQAYADETLVEYRTEGAKDRHVVYHYAMEKNGVREKYQTRKMKQMYEGVYVCGFMLFFGEQMHFYITDDAEEKRIVSSGVATMDARIPEDSDDRFGRINKISMLTAMGRDDEAMKAIADFDRTSYLVEALFGKE